MNLKEKVVRLKALHREFSSSIHLDLAKEIVELEATIPKLVYSTRIGSELSKFKDIRKERLYPIDRGAIATLSMNDGILAPQWLNSGTDVRYAPPKSIILKVIYAEGVKINTSRFSNYPKINKKSYLQEVDKDRKFEVPDTIETNRSLVVVYGVADPLGNFYALLLVDNSYYSRVMLDEFQLENSNYLTGFDLPRTKQSENDLALYIPT